MSYLTENEQQTLALQLAATRGDKGFTDEEFAGVWSEAEGMRIQGLLLTLMLDGHLDWDWRNGKIVMKPKPHPP